MSKIITIKIELTNDQYAQLEAAAECEDLTPRGKLVVLVSQYIFDTVDDYKDDIVHATVDHV